jgi:hypothetical protein
MQSLFPCSELTVQKTPKSNCLSENYSQITDCSEKEAPCLGPMPVGKNLGGPKIGSSFRTLFFPAIQSASIFLTSGMQNIDWIVGVRRYSDIQLLERVPELELYPI